MDVAQGSFAVPLLVRLALEGRQEYLKIKEMPSNYDITKPLDAANFWLACRNDTDGKSHDILYDKSRSTDDEIYFLLPSEMFVMPTKYRCTLKLDMDGHADFAADRFTITVKKPKKP